MRFVRLVFQRQSIFVAFGKRQHAPSFLANLCKNCFLLVQARASWVLIICSYCHPSRFDLKLLTYSWTCSSKGFLRDAMYITCKSLKIFGHSSLAGESLGLTTVPLYSHLKNTLASSIGFVFDCDTYIDQTFVGSQRWHLKTCIFGEAAAVVLVSTPHCRRGIV